MIIYFHLLETHRYIVKYMHNASPFHLADATVAPAQAHPRPGGAVKRCAGPVSLPRQKLRSKPFSPTKAAKQNSTPLSIPSGLLNLGSFARLFHLTTSLAHLFEPRRVHTYYKN
jgi:hypothetical protein